MCPTIDTIIAGVETAFGEPRDVTFFKTTATNCLEWSMPIDELSRSLNKAPKRKEAPMMGDRDRDR